MTSAHACFAFSDRDASSSRHTTSRAGCWRAWRPIIPTDVPSARAPVTRTSNTMEPRLRRTGRHGARVLLTDTAIPNHRQGDFVQDDSEQRWELCGAITIALVIFWALAMWMVTP